MYSHPPLLTRVVKAAHRSTSSKETSACSLPRRGTTYRRWNSESMEKAVKEVELGMPIRQACEIFSVPKSSLHDRVSGKVDCKARSGPTPYLSFEEEEELVSFLIQTAKIGYPHTKKQVLALVQRIVEGKGIETTLSNGWWERFLRRHPKLTLKMAVPLSYGRAIATNPDVLNRYFDMLEETLETNGILDDPSRIFNCDETGLPLSPKCLKIVDKIGSRNPSHITGNTKAQITVLACSCAAGYVIPPFIIFNRKSLSQVLTRGEIPGTLYGLSDSGWMSRDLFFHWFTKHFLLYAPQVRPLLLLLDGHSTHYCPDTINMAAQNQVIIFTLPPHTTHVMQPLDRGCFAPLKVSWRQICHQFIAKNPGKTVSQYDFCRLFSQAWSKAFSIENIVSSFRVTGVYPLDRSVTKAHVLEPNDNEDFALFKPEALTRKTGLAYIPLYSPALGRSKSHCQAVTSTPRRSMDDHELLSNGTFLSSDRSMVLERSLSDPDLHERSFREGSLPTRSASTVGNFLVPAFLPPSKSTTKSAGKVLTSCHHLQFLWERQRQKEMEALQKDERKRVREDKAKAKREQSQTKRSGRNKKKGVSN